MLAKTYSYGINGLEAYRITIEVDVFRGLPSTIIVGLPDNAIRESKERVRSAIRNSGFDFGPKRTTINLSPADMKKEGPSFDLAIAIGILAATEQICTSTLNKFALLGELSLDGKVKSVKGSLPISLRMPKDHFEGLIVPFNNAMEASISNSVDIYPVKTLNEVVYLLNNYENIEPFQRNGISNAGHPKEYDIDFSDVKGQSHVKRGLEIAAAGNHNCLMIGPPGSGKSMLAKRLPSILPEMTQEESLETTKIHSIMGFVKSDQGIVSSRPFRSPHHTTSDVAVVGGGSSPRPGEVTLSHNGILFLDELPEFNRNVLESLRQPLEDQCVTISRATNSVKFPSKFMLVCAMNPCPCGFFTDPKKKCTCTTNQIQKYISRISGPLLDRIDIHLEVPSLKSVELFSDVSSEKSSRIKDRTSQAREVQLKRFDDNKTFANAQMSQRQLKQFCILTNDAQELLKITIEELQLSARAYDKILKISRTIADLEGEEKVLINHVAEAIQYRCLDRGWWG